MTFMRVNRTAMFTPAVNILYYFNNSLKTLYTSRECCATSEYYIRVHNIQNGVQFPSRFCHNQTFNNNNNSTCISKRASSEQKNTSFLAIIIIKYVYF